jgi:RNA 3'-terminal phosphate cyclase (ATP)
VIEIDGSVGEGGGQILRSALALSLATGSAFEITRVRAGRKKPGLLHQHLTAVRAATEIGAAAVTGAELGSSSLTFKPAGLHPGGHRFAVPTAGSAGLVLQAVLPALVLASGPSRLSLEGGTHNPGAPPHEFLARALFPLLGRLGPRLHIDLSRPGFYPAGGGAYRVDVEPAARVRPLDLHSRGEVVSQRAMVLIARLPGHIAERETRTIVRETGWPSSSVEVRWLDGSRGPGNAVVIEVECERVTEVFTTFGARGVPAERVAADAVRQARRYLEADVAVGEHLADQLLVPLALAGGGRFTTLEPTRHTTTNAGVIRQFLDIEVRTDELGPDRFEVTVIPSTPHTPPAY